jgi:UDP-GlcNAc3NAcA epimerase
MLQLLTIAGARPQFIKYAAVSRAIRNFSANKITDKLLHTGQHYDDLMSEVFFRELDIKKPDFHLHTGSATPATQTALILEGIEKILLNWKPDAVLVFGDTNSTLAGALAAVKLQVPVIHIEAGLRSFRKEMPEEINRVLTDHSSTLLCCPTRLAMDNLHAEGFKTHHGKARLNQPAVVLTGDVMYDIFLEQSAKTLPPNPAFTILKSGSPYLLVTLHRAGNTDDAETFTNLLEGIMLTAEKLQMPAYIPMHPRTLNVLNRLEDNSVVKRFLHHPQIMIAEPASYPVFLRLLQDCSLVMTDAGGVQKEAYFSKKPTVVLRDETEWVELTDAGYAAVAGSAPENIAAAAEKMIRVNISSHSSLYGDGNAAKQICREIEYHFG